MSGSFIQIPPNSTGSKVATENRVEIYFDTLIVPILVDDVIVGATSGATGTVTAIIPDTETSGHAFLQAGTGTWVDGEIVQVGAIDHAIVDFSGSKVQQETETQKMIIVDPNHPNHQQAIDRFGATVNTFTDGAPTFSPFGAMTVGERQTIKDYRFAYEDEADRFGDEVVGSGSLSYEPDAGTVMLSTGTPSGDSITRTSHFYHPYAPGVGQLIQMTVRVGDSGKSDVVRQWGYFDDRNGVFWELEGTTLCVVMRSDVSGSVIDTKITQPNFSHDKLDSSDDIRFQLDVSLQNIYWIDLQWLGSGRVRFGVYEPEGDPIVAHVMTHANTVGFTFPYMRTATLPVRVCQFNSGLAGSTSEMRWNAASVKHSSKVLIKGESGAHTSGVQTIADTDGEVALIALRPALTINGITNRGIIKFISQSLMNLPIAGNLPVQYRVRAATTAQITGGTWGVHAGNSAAELNETITSFGASKEVLTYYVAPGNVMPVVATAPRELHSTEIHLDADGTTQPVFFITAKVIGGTGSAMVGAAVNWEEVLT